MEERPSQRNQTVSIRLRGLCLHPGFCGKRARFPYGFLKVRGQLVSFSKDGLFSWKMKLAV